VIIANTANPTRCKEASAALPPRCEGSGLACPPARQSAQQSRPGSGPHPRWSRAADRRSGGRCRGPACRCGPGCSHRAAPAAPRQQRHQPLRHKPLLPWPVGHPIVPLSDSEVQRWMTLPQVRLQECADDPAPAPTFSSNLWLPWRVTPSPSIAPLMVSRTHREVPLEPWSQVPASAAPPPPTKLLQSQVAS
jgi:hypothetical protein